MNKTQIKDKYTKLKSFGYEVRTFQTYRATTKGSKDFPDVFIITPDGYILFVEVKTDNDKLSEGQKEYRKFILERCKFATHLVATPKNVLESIDIIMRKEYHKLKDLPWEKS